MSLSHCFTFMAIWLINVRAHDYRVTAEELPLSVSGRYIVDSKGNRVKLGCVNWYGAEELDFVVGGLAYQSISTVSKLIAGYGFNCVRLPFSLELIDKNPVITNRTVIKQEPSLYGQHAMTILDAVISNLTANNVMVILDNHMSDANWCCSGNDGNGLWYTDNYPESQWLALWKQVVTRYKDNPYVIGCDLRNELRSTTVNGRHLSPSWGTGDNATDWRLAAIKVAREIQAINADLLIIVEGINYALDLQGVATHPILDSDLSVPHKLVYSSHDYSWSQSSDAYQQLSKTLDANWGFIFQQSSQPYFAPVWMGEFGECHENNNGCLQSTWWKSITQYAETYDFEWAYWAIDGTESTGSGRCYGCEETFGVLNLTWNGVASTVLLQDLQALLKPKQK